MPLACNPETQPGPVASNLIALPSAAGKSYIQALLGLSSWSCARKRSMLCAWHSVTEVTAHK